MNSTEFSNKFYHTDELNTDKEYVTVHLMADPVKRIYSRQVGSLLEYLGDIGGLIEIIFITVAGVMGFIIDRNFKAAIIKDMYKV